MNCYRFPENEERRQKWMRNVRRKDWTATKNSVLCSKHFQSSDFETKTEFGQCRKLKTTAVPKIFNHPPSLQPKIEKQRPSPRQRVTSDLKMKSKMKKKVRSQKPQEILKEHNYAWVDLKRSKEKQESVLNRVKKLKKLLKSERKVSQLRKKRCSNLKLVLATLKKKGLLDPSGKEHLDAVLSPALQILLKRLKANSKVAVSSLKYSPELHSFASTLQFYSTKGYEFVRKTFLNALPHVATIRRWFSKISAGPGFSKFAFQLLETKVEEQRLQGKQVFVALTLDEMSLKKKIDYDEKTSRFVGYVDIGSEIVDDNMPPATDVLAVMCVGVNNHFKILLGYFFICGLSGQEKANLVQITLQKIHETGARGLSLTCDGPSAHFSMIKELGANLDPENMRPFFNHPSDSTLRVYIFLDAVHMLKLVRNTLGSEKVLFSSSGPICWRFIEELQNLQEREGLKAGTKLSKRHILWDKNKMKVSLAAQTLSNSVAAAIDFCRDDLLLPEFQGSAATSEFIRLFDALFDLFNSRSLFGKQFKAPLSEENSPNWLSLFSEAVDFIKSLKKKDGIPVIYSRVKTGFIGFLSGIYAMQDLFEELVVHGPLSQILTYKFSQDHLELYFAAVRSKLGANNNPTCKQFNEIFKRLLVHNRIRGSNGNCEILDSTQLLMISSNSSSSDLDVLSTRRCENPHLLTFDEPQDLPLLFQGLSQFKESVVAYISGYVVRMIQRKVCCEECLESLIDANNPLTDQWFQLLKQKKWGSLVVASTDVIKVCLETELLLSKLLIQIGDNLPKESFLALKVSTAVLKKTFSKAE